jgi:hypothetical protein
MKKGALADGRSMFIIRTDHYVSARAFITALTEHFYLSSEEFDPKLKRSEGMKILKNRLFHHGIQGELDTTQYEAASVETWQSYLDAQEAATYWVHKNYPYLIK